MVFVVKCLLLGKLAPINESLNERSPYEYSNRMQLF